MKKIMVLDVKYIQTNHVFLAQTCSKKNLREVQSTLGFGRFKPRTYSAVTQRFSNPKATIILFSTGNTTSMGSTTKFGALRILLMLKNKLNLRYTYIKLTNVVTTIDISKHQKVDLKQIYNKNKSRASYDASIFPCVTLNVPKSNIKANVFASGKVVVTGCSNREVVEKTLKIILEMTKY